MRLRYVSPIELPRTTRESLLVEDRACVHVTPPGEPRKFLRHAPEFIDDPGGTGLFTGIGTATYTSPPEFLTVVPRATLLGYRTLAWDGKFCTDEVCTSAVETERFLSALASPAPFPNEDTGLTPAADDNGDGRVFELDPAGREERAFAGAAVILCSQEPSNFGSFLFRVLPKLHSVRSRGLGHLPMVAWAKGRQFAELLGLCGLPEDRLIRHDTLLRTRFDRALAPGLRNPHAFIDRESRALLRSIARGRPDSGARRLYISRLGRTSGYRLIRRMVNEAEVIEAMVGLGFTVIEPEHLNAVDQVAAFASAEIVVGPAGSGLFNMVFARPETKVVDIESEPHWIYAHAGLFAACHARYGLFVGEVDPSDPAPVHRSFTVNVPALVDRVAAFLAA